VRDALVFGGGLVSLFSVVTLTPMRFPFSNFGYTKTAWALAIIGLLVAVIARYAKAPKHNDKPENPE
jgi:hypothetical protein